MQCNNSTLGSSNQTSCSSPPPGVTCETPLTTENLLSVIYLVIVLILTVFGNVLVIAVVVAYERLQRVTNFFIVSLACADLLVACLSHPFSIYQTLHNQIWCSNLTTCSLWLIVDYIVSCASMCSLAAISIDRLIAISMPFKYSDIITKTTGFLIISAVWVYSFLWGLISLVNWENPGKPSLIFRDAQGHRVSCFGQDPIYITCATVLVFFLPLVVVIVAYSIILKVAITQAKAVAALDPNRNQRKKNFFREVKATKTIALVIGAFVVCWLPLFIIFLASQWDKENTRKFVSENPEAYKAIYYTFLRILPQLNSCVNPIIYAVFNSNFRSAFLKFLHLPHRMPSEMEHSMATTMTRNVDRPSYTTVAEDKPST